MDKQVAAAKKKADADSQKQEMLWQCEMVGLAKYVVEHTEKSQMKTICHWQKSTQGQIAKDRETPKRRGATRGAWWGRGITTAVSSTSDGKFSTLGTVSTVLLTLNLDHNHRHDLVLFKRRVNIQSPGTPWNNHLQVPILVNRNNRRWEATSYGQLQQRNWMYSLFHLQLQGFWQMTGLSSLLLSHPSSPPSLDTHLKHLIKSHNECSGLLSSPPSFPLTRRMT